MRGQKILLSAELIVKKQKDYLYNDFRKVGVINGIIYFIFSSSVELLRQNRSQKSQLSNQQNMVLIQSFFFLLINFR